MSKYSTYDKINGIIRECYKVEFIIFLLLLIVFFVTLIIALTTNPKKAKNETDKKSLEKKRLMAYIVLGLSALFMVILLIITLKPIFEAVNAYNAGGYYFERLKDNPVKKCIGLN